MKSILRRLIKSNILLCFLLAIFSEKSVFAEEQISVIQDGIVITDTVQQQQQIIVYQDTILPETTGFKSYMSYKALSPTSTQGILQKYCHTDEDGFRKFNDRYVVAVGSGANASIGDFIDITLENNEVIYAVVGDLKQNKHTDSTNLVGGDGSCVEFIVDTSVLHKGVRQSGNAGKLKTNWDCPEAMFRVYKTY